MSNNWYPQSPVGWEDLDDCLRVAWRNQPPFATLPRGGILDALHPDAEAERLAQEAEEAHRDDLRNIAENVILLDDHRWRKRDEYRETL